MQDHPLRLVLLRTLTLSAVSLLASLATGQGTFVEDLPFAHRPQTLRSGVFFNDRFANNRWRVTDPPPAVQSSHYAYFSEKTSPASTRRPSRSGCGSTRPSPPTA